MSLKQGQYLGKIANYGIKETKAGDPAPTVIFSIRSEEGGSYTCAWQGSFKSEVATDITLKALITCGLERGEDIPRLAEGLDSGLLDTDKEYSLKVELEESSEKQGQFYARVRGISDPGSSGIQNSITKEETQTRIANLNLSASFAKIKAKMPAPSVKDIPSPTFG